MDSFLLNSLEIFLFYEYSPFWVDVPVFPQLQLGMDQDKRASVNAPPHSEGCFCFKLETMEGTHTRDSSA